MTKHRPRNRSQSARQKSRQKRPESGQAWLWGHHAVLSALQNPRREIKQLVATRNAAAKLGQFGSEAEDLPPGDIDHLLPPGAVHQGVAARVSPLPESPIVDITRSDMSCVIVLDQVSDPHNLGAIFRSAAAFGAGAIILQSRNAPPITGVVAKSAVGAIELVAECRVVNIARALEHLAEAGFHTIGLAGEGTASIARAVSGAGKIAIVLGAEGAGLRPGVAKACAELARIEIDSAMESLNVSNAAAIALYEAARALKG